MNRPDRHSVLTELSARVFIRLRFTAEAANRGKLGRLHQRQNHVKSRTTMVGLDVVNGSTLVFDECLGSG